MAAWVEKTILYGSGEGGARLRWERGWAWPWPCCCGCRGVCGVAGACSANDGATGHDRGVLWAWPRVEVATGGVKEKME